MINLKFNYILSIAIILLCILVFSAAKSINTIDFDTSISTNKQIKSLLKKMTYLEGGAFNMGFTTNHKMTESDTTLFSNSIPRRVIAESYYLCATEVTNAEWREFYEAKIIELGSERAKRKYYPDTSLWTTEFPYSFNKPMTDNYFSHRNFNEYPVVGVSWDQANAYCDWKSNKINALFKKRGIQSTIEFRLPSEMEWECAAIKKDDKRRDLEELVYVWPTVKGIGKFNEVANIGLIKDINEIVLKQYADDGCLYTCKVASYPPSYSGIFDLGGNVSEWTGDKAVTWSFDFNTDKRKKSKQLESPREIANEIEIMQNKIDAGDRDAEFYLKWLLHDQKVLTSKNLKICKGGNWADGLIYAQIGSRQGVHKDKPSSRIGFRVAISNVSEEVRKYFPKKRWKPKN